MRAGNPISRRILLEKGPKQVSAESPHAPPQAKQRRQALPFLGLACLVRASGCNSGPTASWCYSCKGLLHLLFLMTLSIARWQALRSCTSGFAPAKGSAAPPLAVVCTVAAARFYTATEPVGDPGTTLAGLPPAASLPAGINGAVFRGAFHKVPECPSGPDGAHARRTAGSAYGRRDYRHRFCERRLQLQLARAGQCLERSDGQWRDDKALRQKKFPEKEDQAMPRPYPTRYTIVAGLPLLSRSQTSDLNEVTPGSRRFVRTATSPSLTQDVKSQRAKIDPKSRNRNVSGTSVHV